MSHPTRPRCRMTVALIATAALLLTAAAAAAQTAAPEMAARIKAIEPALERYVKAGMAAFDVPGAAVGVVAGDRLVYAREFGVRRKGGSEPVDAKTVFQIGSTTKAFLATALAIAVDRGKLKWDERIVDLDPSFVLEDPYVTREFRIFDLAAQRSGLPPYANDALSGLGYGAGWMIRSLRDVAPVTSFRTTFAYTNITHLFAGRLVAKVLGAADWPALARREILDPLGMRETSFTADAIEQAPDHAVGHRWTLEGTVPIAFDPSFPYSLGAAGDINSTLEDCARWLALQIGDGVFEGHRLVSAKNLAVTRMPRVAMSDTLAYAMGWVITSTPNGRVVWHNGGTTGFGAHIGFIPAKGVGVIVLTNEQNKGLPDAIALWAYDRLLGNPEKDYAKETLARVKEAAAKERALYKRPPTPRPPPDFAALAGEYRSDELGPASLAAEGGRLVLTLKETAAQLELNPFDGAVFTARLVPQGRFARIVAINGDEPIGFVDFAADKEGRLAELRLISEGQTHPMTKIEPPQPAASAPAARGSQ